MDNDGVSALMRAKARGQDKVVELLIGAGAVDNLRTSDRVQA